MNTHPCLIKVASEFTEHSANANKGFLLTIRADDGSTMLETAVEHVHLAFQKLIDWSIEVDRDVSAIVSGPNGFYANHRIKASPDFRWIES